MDALPRVVIHDYAGHVGQLLVARALARRGYAVTFLYASFLETPQALDGNEVSPDEPFVSRPISIPGRFHKHNYLRRQWQEALFGRQLIAAVEAARPDAVLSANTPLVPQYVLLLWARQRRLPFVHWVTDAYGTAVDRVLREKYGWVGSAVGSAYLALDRYIARHADSVIVISDRFSDLLRELGVVRPDIDSVPVCAPLEAVRPHPKDNSWARRHGLHRTRNAVYAGTLGRKHDPQLFVALADHLRDLDDVRVVVISEGPAMDWLAERKKRDGLDHLVLLPFQRSSEFSEVLGAADVLLTILDSSAADFSIPSKVLSHFCAARVQVASVRSDNWTARIIEQSGAGVVVAPGDIRSWCAAVRGLLNDRSRATQMGRRGREFAEQHYGIEHLVERYVDILVRHGVVPSRISLDVRRAV